MGKGRIAPANAKSSDPPKLALPHSENQNGTLACRHLGCHGPISSSSAVPAATGRDPGSISVIVRARHVIAAHRANQFAAPRFQPLGANGTILRSIFLWGNCPRLRRELRRCVLRRLRPSRRRPWLHGLFHGGGG